MVKIFAIGSLLMKDDIIGILVGREIEEEVKKAGAQLYICETDIEYALSNIQEKDSIIIIDAMISGRVPGEVKLIPGCSIESTGIYTQHSLNLIQAVKLYNSKIKVHIIGIEAENISCGLGISDKLREALNKISGQVINIIKLFSISE